MSEKKEQKIIVFLSLTPSDQTLILNGLKIASIFRKTLCLCFNYPRKQKKYHSCYKEKLCQYVASIEKKVQDIQLSSLLISVPFETIAPKLSDNYEAIFAIAPKTGHRKYLSALRESKIPFLFVDEKQKIITDYKKIILPVDLRKRNSDSTLWASHFGRFNNTQIVILAANDKIRENQKQGTRNIRSAQNLFLKFNIQHQIRKGEKNSFGNADEALQLAFSLNADCIIILGSSSITPLDRLVGLPEKKLIRNSGHLPVLIINPRKDSYILCA